MIFLIVYLASIFGNVLILVACKYSETHAERFGIESTDSSKTYFCISITPVIGAIFLPISLLVYASAWLSEFKH